MTVALEAWSYSRWDLHHTCPLKFKLQVLEKRPEPPSPAMVRGDKIHKALAAYLQTPDKVPLPVEEAGKQLTLVQELVKFDDRIVEQQWAFDRNWQRTDWFSRGNKSKPAWLRSVLDVAVMYDDGACEAVDWKTGQARDTHEDQMELFAVSVMCRAPFVTHVTTRLAYIDHDHAEFGEYPATDRDKLIAKWEEKVRPMFEDTTYLPRPNAKCQWCQFSKSKGGPCRYG